MKKTLGWAATATLAILIVGYISLTAGTRFLLPQPWKKIQTGMPRQEARDLIPPEWVDSWRWYTSHHGPDFPHRPPSNWMATPNPDVVPGNFDLISGKTGLRIWNMRIEYKNGTVSQIEREHIDLHDRLILNFRLRWGDLR